MVQCMIFWLFSWSSVMLGLVLVMNTPLQPGISLLFFVLTPLIGLACVLCVNAHRNGVTHMNVAAVDSATECELKARFQQDALTEALRTAASQNIELVLSPAQVAANDKLINNTDELLTFGAKRFPSAAMLLTRAHYTLAFRCGPFVSSRHVPFTTSSQFSP